MGMRNESVRTMYTGFIQWLKWVVLFLIFMAFPAFLIILSKVHADLVPGILIGIATYFLFFNREKDIETK